MLFVLDGGVAGTSARCSFHRHVGVAALRHAPTLVAAQPREAENNAQAPLHGLDRIGDITTTTTAVVH